MRSPCNGQTVLNQHPLTTKKCSDRGVTETKVRDVHRKGLFIPSISNYS